MARWRSRASPATIACVVRRICTYDQAAEHRECGDRDSDIGQHAFRDLAAGLCRLPCQTGDGAALRVGDGSHVLIAGLGRPVDPVQAGELQPIANPV